jgi:hypothetical protein
MRLSTRVPVKGSPIKACLRAAGRSRTVLLAENIAADHSPAMKRFLPISALCALAILLSGCLTAPVSNSGGMGATTVPNTNVTALISSAQAVFAQYGYSPGPMSYPYSISFDKPSGGFGKLLYGSYGTTTTVRVKLTMLQLPGTNDYRLGTRVSRVTDAGEAGFEDSKKMVGLWSGEFGPILQKINAQAANAGPM